MRDAPAAIVAREPEAREAERAHHLHHVGRHRALRVAGVAASLVGLRRIAIAAQVGAHDGERLRERGRDPMPHRVRLRIAVQQQQRRTAAANSQWISAPEVATRRVVNPGKSSLIASSSYQPSRWSRLAPLRAKRLATGCAAATLAIERRAEPRRARAPRTPRRQRRAIDRRRPTTSNSGDFRSTGARATTASARPRTAWMLARCAMGPVGLCGAKSTPCSRADARDLQHAAKAARVLDVRHQHVVELAGAHRLAPDRRRRSSRRPRFACRARAQARSAARSRRSPMDARRSCTRPNTASRARCRA